MQHVQNEMRRQAQGVLNGIDNVRVGIVQNYRPFMCKVLLQTATGETLTNWLPIQSLWIGDGWGMFAPPKSGSPVWVVPVEGSLDAAYVVPGFFDGDHQPLEVPQGEFWLVHESGATFKMTNDSEMTLAANTINLNGNVVCKHGYTGAIMDGLGKTYPVIGGIILEP